MRILAETVTSFERMTPKGWVEIEVEATVNRHYEVEVAEVGVLCDDSYPNNTTALTEAEIALCESKVEVAEALNDQAQADDAAREDAARARADDY